MVDYLPSKSKYKSYPSQDSRNPTWSIFVGNISCRTNERELRSSFEKVCGDINTVRLFCDNQTRQSRGFGFVQFDTFSAYETALTLNRSSLAERKLKTSPSQSKVNLPPITMPADAMELDEEEENTDLTLKRLIAYVLSTKRRYQNEAIVALASAFESCSKTIESSRGFIGLSSQDSQHLASALDPSLVHEKMRLSTLDYIPTILLYALDTNWYRGWR